MNNAIQIAFTDKFGASHADGLHVLEQVNVNRRQRTATAIYGCYHDAASRTAGKPCIELHSVVATNIELTCVSFDDLIENVVEIGLADDSFFAGGTAVEVTDPSAPEE